MTKIPVDSIKIPARFVRVATRWHGNITCKLYAVCSTGGLTTGIMCPVSDYNTRTDKMEKWYLTIWRELSCDVSRAEDSCRGLLKDRDGRGDNWELERRELIADLEDLQAFEEWVDCTVVPSLEESYGLENWDICEG